VNLAFQQASSTGLCRTGILPVDLQTRAGSPCHFGLKNSLSIVSRGARRLGDLPKTCHLLPFRRRKTATPVSTVLFLPVEGHAGRPGPRAENLSKSKSVGPDSPSRSCLRSAAVRWHVDAAIGNQTNKANCDCRVTGIGLLSRRLAPPAIESTQQMTVRVGCHD
jgi:hypothetical protein